VPLLASMEMVFLEIPGYKWQKLEKILGCHQICDE
jgi:hypothetical protein